MKELWKVTLFTKYLIVKKKLCCNIDLIILGPFVIAASSSSENGATFTTSSVSLEEPDTYSNSKTVCTAQVHNLSSSI